MLKDMRSFLNILEEQGDLVHITKSVSPRFEVAAGIRKTSDIQGPALIFDKVIGSFMPVVGGLYAARRRIILGLETSESEIHKKITQGLRNHIQPRMVSDAPCKEVILTGKDADFGYLPICTHNRKDAGPYITIGLAFARHPEYGNNVTISRIQIFDGKTAGVRSVIPHHLAVYFASAEKQGKPLELAITIGNDPYVTLCSQISGAIDLDELNVAGGWMGEPVDLVKCHTNDVAVPATSEIVLEGELIPGERRMEGPFGEFPGYYQGTMDQAVFSLKAITHRRNPIYLTALTGRPSTDNHVLTQVPKEAIIYDRLRQICPSIRDVCITKGGAGMHLVVSIRPTFATQARDVMLAAFNSAGTRSKLVIVVDDDIDVRNPEQVEWAIATRFQADQDVVIIPRQFAMALDPSAPGLRTGAVMGIDATRPFGKDFAEVADVPESDSFVIPGWTDRRHI
jgi:4-hydroxy-3-polyprenylbenzoate decarboxylase/2,5-furandicarboxylate decarboxylase 1